MDRHDEADRRMSKPHEEGLSALAVPLPGGFQRQAEQVRCIQAMHPLPSLHGKPQIRRVRATRVDDV